MATWQPLRTRDGTWTLVHPGHGEACHASAGAWSEARGRYAAECRLRERALAGELSAAGRFRLLDVGTGLGWNLAAALDALEGTGVRLEAVALERDPAVIAAAAALARCEEGEEGEGAAAPAAWRAAVDALARAVEEGSAAFGGGFPGEVRLLLGDARATLPTLAPGFDAVFLDAFSPRVEPELWSEAFLADVAARMAPGGLLSTYSAATAVRVALARAGLGVRRGAKVTCKAEGTVAGPGVSAPPGDRDLVRRLARRLDSASGNPEGPGGPGNRGRGENRVPPIP